MNTIRRILKVSLFAPVEVFGGRAAGLKSDIFAHM